MLNQTQRMMPTQTNSKGCPEGWCQCGRCMEERRSCKAEGAVTACPQATQQHTHRNTHTHTNTHTHQQKIHTQPHTHTHTHPDNKSYTLTHTHTHPDNKS